MSKRFNLVLPLPLYERLKKMADWLDSSVVGTIIKCAKLGMLVYEAQNDPDKQVIIKREGVEREVHFL